MLYLISLILLMNLASRGHANGIDIHAPLAKVSHVAGSICAAGDFSTLFQLPYHYHHNHEDICLQTAQPNETTPVEPAKWTADPICRSFPQVDTCVYANSSFGGGRGILFITSADIGEEMAKLPAFTSPQVSKTIESPPFEVRPLNGRGFGVVANKTIERGDRIMAIQPLVAVHGDAFQPPEDSDFSFFNLALNYLPNSSLALYTSLAAHFQRADNNWEKLNTNAFSEDLGGKEHWIVLPETARMNHDCRPNAIYYFEQDILTHYVHATRRIFAGEEITIPYTEPIQTQKQRANALRRSWGFSCTCSVCRASPELILESNRRIKTIQKLTEQLEDLSLESSATPETGELLVSLYEMERLYSGIADAYLLTSMAYNAVGKDWKTVEFAMKAVEAAMVNYGPKSSQVKQAKKLMLSPRSHESWMSRRQDA